MSEMQSRVGFNIEEFRSRVFNKGFLFPNRHIIRIPRLWSFVGNDYEQLLGTTGDQMEFWCRGASLPGVSLATHNIFRYGYGAAEKRPFLPVFNDVNLTIFGDRKGDNIMYFKEWIRSIDNYRMAHSINGDSNAAKNTVNNEPADPFEISYKKEYAVDLQIVIFTNDGEPSVVVKMRDAFPVFVGDITSDWQDNGTVLQIPVSFTFTDWFYDYSTTQLSRSSK